MYALIPQLSTLPPQTRLEVQVAFAESLAVLWRVLTVIGCAGFVASLFMKGIPLHKTVNADWALKNEKVDWPVATHKRKSTVRGKANSLVGIVQIQEK